MELLVNKQGFILLLNQTSPFLSPINGTPCPLDTEAAGKMWDTHVSYKEGDA